MQKFLKSMSRPVKSVFKHLRLNLGWPIQALRNQRRSRAKIDYITLTLPSTMPVLPEPREWWRSRLQGAAPLSLLELERLLQRIADDPRPKGIILTIREVALPLSRLQTLHRILTEFRQQGKRIICYAQGYTNATYFIASAADEIVLQPGGTVDTVGLRVEALFLKDALQTLGLQLDSVAISPYKGALDQFTRREPSAEGQAQLEWILDSQFHILTETMAAARQVQPETIHQMINTAPHLDSEALAAGYITAIETEEDLHRRLNSKHIVRWGTAQHKLLLKRRPVQEKMVAVLNVSGMMVNGESDGLPLDLPIPFIGGERAGDVTVVQQVRRLMLDESAAAVVLYINSGGGSATAAEAMTAALEELAKTRPVVVFMDGVAASGGYYIATAAQWIVAQPGTITGSIGVILGKPVTAGLLEKIRANRTIITRGENANLFSDGAPFTEPQRQKMWLSIQHIYQQFVGRVARARQLTPEAVDAVGGGRVWTGAQALDHHLVDELGDMQTALKKARQLANLPEDAPAWVVMEKGKPLPAQLAAQTQPAAYLTALERRVTSLLNARPQLLLPIEWGNLR
jgi:protease IV